LYRQAGNSIVVNVLMAIFKELLKWEYGNNQKNKEVIKMQEEHKRKIKIELYNDHF
jgi:hypothetical protein